MKRLVDKLLAQESVELDDLSELLGPSKHQTKENLENYIKDLKQKKAELKKEKEEKEKKEETKK